MIQSQAEAELLRIEALVQRGDVTTARAQAARALAAAPNGPHAARLREIASLLPDNRIIDLCLRAC